MLSPERVRAQLSEQRGGADVVLDAKDERTGGARMLAVVTLKSGETGRHYRLPYRERLSRCLEGPEDGCKAILMIGNVVVRRFFLPEPDERDDAGGGSGAGGLLHQKYGMMHVGATSSRRGRR